MAESSQEGWAFLGKLSLLIGVLLGLNQVYIHFIKTEVSVQGEGSCQSIYLPGSLFGSVTVRDVFPNSDQIEKTLPEGLDNKYGVALAIANLNVEQKKRLESAVDDLKSIRSYCSFSVFNDGSKEVQDIKFELPREGIFFMQRLGEEPKEAAFKKVIPIGKLNPGERVGISTWHQGYNAWAPFDSEHSDFRLTHTSGIGEVKFFSQNTSIIGSFYERHPYISFTLFMGILLLTGWVGVELGKSNEKLRVEEESKKKAEQIKRHEEPKTETMGGTVQVEPSKDGEATPPSPS